MIIADDTAENDERVSTSGEDKPAHAASLAQAYASKGLVAQIEMDEMLFRSKAIMLKDLLKHFPKLRSHIPEEFDEETEVRICTLRLFGAQERGTRKLYLQWMDFKIVQAGSGGPIRNEELYALIHRNGNWLLFPGCIVHADSARAYCNLAFDPVPMQPQEEAKISKLPATINIDGNLEEFRRK